MAVLLAGGAIYGFYINDYLQEMMCVADMYPPYYYEKVKIDMPFA